MLQAKRDFQVFAKPAGPLCNLECRYCYYVGKQPGGACLETLRMPDGILEEYIAQHIAAARGPTVAFSWHGGEPTLLGLDYFRKIVALERKHLPRGKTVFNGMQTNGVLLDEAWCRFLAAEKFGIGLSLDGPEALHDCYRRGAGGQPTHRRVLGAHDLMRHHGVSCDILCAVHDRNVRQPLDVYRHFREIGARNISFLPVVVRARDAGNRVEPCTVPAEEYGSFLCAIFDAWTRQDVGRISVQIFEEAIRPLQRLEHSLCIFRARCGDIPVVEHDGSLYSCDHFVERAHRLGNIRETPLVRMLESPAQRAFGNAKRDALPGYCRRCEVLDMCNGGCPKDRFCETPDGESGLNYLCAGFKRFFTHCRPYFLRVLEASRAARAGEKEPGRNDPCPCGSGLKYKKCCMGKRGAAAKTV